MTREELAAAGDRLDEAADAASGDLADDLADQAETVRSLADQKYDPDHGRLARLEHSLRSLKERGSEEVEEAIDEAMAKIKAFRETVEGV